MGDPKTEEDMKEHEHITNHNLCVSDENQNNLNEKGALDRAEEKPDLSNSRGEQSENISKMENSSDGSISDHYHIAPGPSPSLLAALRSLGEHSDHMLLPHSLHQIAEAYFLEDDYPWAVEFLRLERLYHERLLSNLASLQQDWESQWKSGAQANSNSAVKTNRSDTESQCMDTLSHICRTHQRPSHTLEKGGVLQGVLDPTLKRRSRQEESSTGQQTNRNITRTEHTAHTSQLQTGEEEEEDDEEEVEEEDLMEELQQEDGDGEPACGEQLAKLIEVEESFPSNGLVSILKKRTCVEENDPDSPSPSRSSYKRKVRFSESEDTLDNDEVGGASCLVFLLLCLVTVVISMGGTALYCLVGGAYSNICTDFSHNMDFYFGPVQRLFTSRSS